MLCLLLQYCGLIGMCLWNQHVKLSCSCWSFIMLNAILIERSTTSPAKFAGGYCMLLWHNINLKMSMFQSTLINLLQGSIEFCPQNLLSPNTLVTNWWMTFLPGYWPVVGIARSNQSELPDVLTSFCCTQWAKLEDEQSIKI